MKPTDFQIGARVKIGASSDEHFFGREGVVVERPPARYVWVWFPEDGPEHRGHPFRVDEIATDSSGDAGGQK